LSKKSPINVEVSILKLSSGTGVATFFCSENEKWAIIQELFEYYRFSGEFWLIWSWPSLKQNFAMPRFWKILFNLFKAG